MISGTKRKSVTDRTLKALKKAPDGKPYDVKDSEVSGLRVRVMGSGQRTFVLLARYPGSPNPTRRALGAYGDISLEQAREKARDWRKLIRRGVDPQLEEQRQRQATLRQQQNTFGVVAEAFIKEKLPGERKGREVERDIRREFMPRWEKQPIVDITPQDVRDVVRATKDRGAPYQAHNLLVTARRLFSWAIDQQAYGLETSPCDRLKPKAIIGRKVFRTRILDDDELRALWRATRRLGYPYAPLFRMLALTGQRKSEVAEARWSEIDLAKKLWIIPAERMKAEAAHVVPLTDDVIALLGTGKIDGAGKVDGLPRFKKGDHLFSTTFGKKPVSGFSKAKERLGRRMLRSWRALARSQGKDRSEAVIEPWVIHDIRRTMRTSLSALPVPDLVRELVIGHTKPGLHKVYDQHAYLDEKRRALDLWATRLRGIVEHAPANVISIKSARERVS
jgi:integrase